MGHSYSYPCSCSNPDCKTFFSLYENDREIIFEISDHDDWSYKTVILSDDQIKGIISELSNMIKS